jgi:hypothetical protein
MFQCFISSPFLKNKNRSLYNPIIKKYTFDLNRLQFTFPDETVKCKLYDKKYISHDTFLASYKLEEDRKVFVPSGMHVSVM